MDWELEAKKQAADAGELKIALAERLEEVCTSIRIVEKQAKEEETFAVYAQLFVKLLRLQSEAEWLKKVLYGR